MLVERSSTLAPDTEQEDKAEQPPQDYAAKGEQALDYDSDYASTYDYPTTEDTNGNLSLEAVCVFQCYPFFLCSNPLCAELVLILGFSTVGRKLLRPKFNGIPITPWI